MDCENYNRNSSNNSNHNLIDNRNCNIKQGEDIMDTNEKSEHDHG